MWMKVWRNFKYGHENLTEGKLRSTRRKFCRYFATFTDFDKILSKNSLLKAANSTTILEKLEL